MPTSTEQEMTPLLRRLKRQMQAAHDYAGLEERVLVEECVKAYAAGAGLDACDLMRQWTGTTAKPAPPPKRTPPPRSDDDDQPDDRPEDDGETGRETRQRLCSICHGTGLDTAGGRCARCRGTGRTPQPPPPSIDDIDDDEKESSRYEIEFDEA
jgi:hypothetical protein